MKLTTGLTSAWNSSLFKYFANEIKLSREALHSSPASRILTK